jgi:1-acyl-sn-glycerol-3-phosphate acyltransferase
LATLFILVLPVLGCIALLPPSFRFKNKLLFRMMHIFFWCGIRSTFISVSYKGLENLPTEPAIFIANHQSSLDIPLIGILAQGMPHIWLARGELMETMLISLLLPLFTIVIDIHTARSAAISLRKTLRLLQATQAHIMIFPEGSRFDDGKIHSFFDGFAFFAVQLKRPVIPVYINGLNKVYPKNSWFITNFPVTITVGPAFYCKEDETLDIFQERVHKFFVTLADN